MSCQGAALHLAPLVIISEPHPRHSLLADGCRLSPPSLPLFLSPPPPPLPYLAASESECVSQALTFLCAWLVGLTAGAVPMLLDSVSLLLLVHQLPGGWPFGPPAIWSPLWDGTHCPSSSPAMTLGQRALCLHVGTAGPLLGSKRWQVPCLSHGAQGASAWSVWAAGFCQFVFWLLI